jgi:hypothetical protein
MWFKPFEGWLNIVNMFNRSSTRAAIPPGYARHENDNEKQRLAVLKLVVRLTELQQRYHMMGFYQADTHFRVWYGAYNMYIQVLLGGHYQIFANLGLPGIGSRWYCDTQAQMLTHLAGLLDIIKERSCE